MKQAANRAGGMTLIEVLATLAIMLLLSALAIPAFRAMSARQSLVATQKGLESTVSRLRQLSLAPHDEGLTSVVGYGLLVLKKEGDSPIRVGDCSLNVPNDTVALVRVSTSVGGAASVSPVDVTDPATGRCRQTEVAVGDYPNAFFVAHRDVRLRAGPSDPPLPWMVTIPLRAIGEDLGQVCAGAGTCGLGPYANPLQTDGTARLRAVSTVVRDVSDRRNYLCREVEFNEGFEVVTDSRVVSGGCDEG